MEGADVPERRQPFKVANETRLGPFVEKLAEDTKAFGQPALAGDPLFFQRLEAFRATVAKEYTRSLRLRTIRSEADKAWRNRKFDKLIDLYTSIENDLTRSEKGKLQYARKHRAS